VRCSGYVGRMITGLFALSVAVSACAAPPAAAIDCGPATALVPHPTSPELTGAPIGPLLIRGAYPPGAKDATVFGFARGSPTKMLVLVAHDMESDVALTGTRCSDGQALRFWLNKGGGAIWSIGPTSTPVPDEVMASTGDVRAVLPKIDALAAGTGGYAGYMLFPTAGAYRIDGFVGARKIGQVTVVVSTEPFPASRPAPSREPANLAFATGERELIAQLQNAGIPVLSVAGSTLDGLFGPAVAARYLQLDTGAIEALFLPDGSVGEFHACAEAGPGGRYLYRLTWRGQTRTIDSSQLIWYIVASKDAVIQVYGDLQTAQRVADKIGTTIPVAPLQPNC